MNDLLGIGTRVQLVPASEAPPGQKATIVGLAFTRDPKVSQGGQRVCYVLSMEPGFWNEGRTTYLSTLVVHTDSVVALPSEPADLTLLEAVRGVTVLGTNPDGGVVVGPVGWFNLVEIAGRKS